MELEGCVEGIYDTIRVSRCDISVGQRGGGKSTDFEGAQEPPDVSQDDDNPRWAALPQVRGN